MNSIELDDIRFRSEYCKGTNQDCKDLLEHIDVLTSNIDCDGSLLQRITDNITAYVDVETEVHIDKRALQAFIQRSKI